MNRGANVMDVCEQLKIAIKALPKDKHGKPIKGMAIRGGQHHNFASPITQRLLGDGRIPVDDLPVTRQSLGSSQGEPLYAQNISIKTTIPTRPNAEFF